MLDINRIRLSITVFLFLFLSACGGGGDTPPAGGGFNPTGSAAGLVGTWLSGCYDLGGGFYAVSSTTINADGSYSATAEAYDDAVCTSLTQTQVFSGSMTLGSEFTTTNGTMVTETNTVVDALTVNGVSDMSVPFTVYNIVSVQGDIRFSGGASANDSIDRPTVLDLTVPFIRQLSGTFIPVGSSLGIVGTWRTDCIDLGNGAYAVVEDTINSDGSISSLTDVFDDAVCSSLVQEQDFTGSITLGAEFTTASGPTVTEINFLFETQTIDGSQTIGFSPITAYSITMINGDIRTDEGFGDSNINNRPTDYVSPITYNRVPANAIPVANAGLDENAIIGTPFMLDGSASSDTDGVVSSYTWSFVSGPMGTSVTDVSDPAIEMPSFTPDLAGAYQFSLLVSDGIDDSVVDTVIITAFSSTSAHAASIEANYMSYQGDEINIGQLTSSTVVVTFIGTAFCSPIDPYINPAASSVSPATIYGCDNNVLVSHSVSAGQTSVIFSWSIPTLYADAFMEVPSLSLTSPAYGLITDIMVNVEVALNDMGNGVFQYGGIISSNSSYGTASVFADNSLIQSVLTPTIATALADDTMSFFVLPHISNETATYISTLPTFLLD